MADDEEKHKLTFDHQCFLMDYADEILSKLNEQCAYENFHAMGNSTGTSVHDIITALTGRGALKRIPFLTPSEQGMLQPTLRLYRVFPGQAGAPDSEDEFIFETALNPNTIEAITTGGGRAGGNGIKSFEWTFGGTNPAEAEAVINVKMTLYFQNVKELSKGWSTGDAGGLGAHGTTSGTPSFLELILLPPGSKLPSGEYDPLFYKIKASVGWAVPPGIEDQQLVRELRGTQLVMYLNLITHELKIKEDGTIEVDVEYIGSSEVALESGAADVLFPVGSGGGGTVSEGFLGFGVDDRTVEDLDAEIEALEEHLDDNSTSQECAGGEDSSLNEERDEMLDAIEDLQEKRRELNAENRSQAYEAFTKAISGKIRHLDLDNGFLEEWEENANNERIPMTSDSSGGVATITIGDQGWFSDPAGDAADADSSDVSDDDVFFVFLGDIIEVACLSFADAAQMVEDNPVKNMSVITGPMEYINPRTASERQKAGEPPEVISLNLADVPVSYTMFLKFWNDNVVSAERDSYPVRKFIKDVINRIVIPSVMPGCFPNVPSGITPVISTALFTVAAPGTPRDMVGEIIPSSGARRDVNDIKGYVTSQGGTTGADLSGWTYIFLYMNTAAIGTGDQREDEARGIYHYRIGQDRGLVKKIDFKKNDVQGLKEARQDDSGAISQLREMYNADVKMLGNNIYIPGMTVFLHPPPGLGNPAQCNSDANLLGLGGYYNIIKVRSNIKRGGQYDTDLECVFAASTSVNCNGDPCDSVQPTSDYVAEDDPWAWADDAWDAMMGDDDFRRGEPGVDYDAENPCQGEPTPDPWWDW